MNPFPALAVGTYTITSSATPSYNCIAWAASEDFRWWWPTPGLYYWPPAAPPEETLEAFTAAFASMGYEQCDDGKLEPSFLKVAIYASEGGVPTHMARQLPDGAWTSKLGCEIDLTHANPNVVEGPAYGSVVRFLKRKID